MLSLINKEKYMKNFKHNFINHSKGETEGSRANMENKEIASEYSRQDLSRVAFIRSIYSLSMVCYVIQITLEMNNTQIVLIKGFCDFMR